MTKLTRHWLQLILIASLVAAGARIAIVFYGRYAPPSAEEKPAAAPPLEADAYVQPKKLHDYDAASLRKDLAGQSAWVREGYRFSYYACDAPRHHADFRKEAGTPGPIEKLDIRDVVTQSTAGGAQQVLAVFARDGHDWCLPVGVIQGGVRQIYADEILFYEDPRVLYRHWPADVWDAIARHQVKPGMNELQASFAAGMGTPEPGERRVVRYPNGGHPLVVTYENGRATSVAAG